MVYLFNNKKYLGNKITKEVHCSFSKDCDFFKIYNIENKYLETFTPDTLEQA